MKALLQRVTSSSVTVDGGVVGHIERGLMVLLGVGCDDDDSDAERLARKTAQLRIFADSNSKFNISAVETRAEILVVSQFTLMANTARGRRPSFSDAAPPQLAERLVNLYISTLERMGFKVETGVFGAHMQVEIHNDGPVTILLDSKDRRKM